MIEIRAADVEHEGRKVNWSESRSSIGGWVKAKYRYKHEHCFARAVARGQVCVIDIGLKSTD